MKKILVIMISVLMLLSLTACGSKSDNNTAGSTETVVEDTKPENAVMAFQSGASLQFVTEDGKYLTLSENGWHLSLGDTPATFTVDKAGSGEKYVLTDSNTGMRIDVYNNETGTVGATVAMYTASSSYADNEVFEFVRQDEENYKIKFITNAGLAIGYEDGATDTTLVDAENGIVFYMIEVK